MTADRRRIRITAGNLKNHTLPVTVLREFFPKDAVGGPTRKSANGHGFELTLDGLGKTVHTDIASDAKSGRGRFLRCRGEIGKFFKHHEVKAGGYVEVVQLDYFLFFWTIRYFLSSSAVSSRRETTGIIAGPLSPTCSMQCRTECTITLLLPPSGWTSSPRRGTAVHQA